MSITPMDDANFTPDYIPPKIPGLFKWWVQTTLPAVYDDSLSYYQLMCKVVKQLNNVIEQLDDTTTNVGNLYAAYEKLQQYVNDYFSSLDVQQEIDNKLDQMVADGTLSNLIRPFILQFLPPLAVDSVSEMTDTNRIYILKSNSHIYQYNNVWIDTGIVYGGTIGNFFNYNGQIAIGADANDLYTFGSYKYFGNNKPANMPPDTARGIIAVFKGEATSNSGTVQVVFDSQYRSTWYREYTIGGGWGAWQGGMPFVYCGQIAAGNDANSMTTYGSYKIIETGIPANMPVGFTRGSLLVLRGETIGSNAGTVQMAVDVYTGIMYVREYRANTWSTWNYAIGFEFYGEASPELDANSMYGNGTYKYYGANKPINMPPDSLRGILAIFKGTATSNSGTVQIAFDSANHATWYREYTIGGGWGAWAGGMPFVYCGQIAAGNDANSMTTYGSYKIIETGIPANMPVGFTRGSLLVLRGETIGSNAGTVQMAVDVYTGTVYVREFTVASGWRNWVNHETEDTIHNETDYYKYLNTEYESNVAVDLGNKEEFKILTYNVAHYDNDSSVLIGDNGNEDKVLNFRNLLLEYPVDLVCTQEDAQYIDSANSKSTTEWLYAPLYSYKLGVGGPAMFANTNVNFQNKIDGTVTLRKATLVKGAKSLVVYCTHLAVGSYDARVAQLANIKNIITADAPENYIIVGDFNTLTEQDYTYLKQWCAENNLSMGNGGFGGRKITTVSNYAIDNALAGSGVTITGFKVLGNWYSALYSDHFPVVITVKV